jgi:hypothetical protein
MYCSIIPAAVDDGAGVPAPAAVGDGSGPPPGVAVGAGGGGATTASHKPGTPASGA